MNSCTKSSPASGVDIPYDVPFKILSEKQLEWVQFKAKQKLLEMKEEEEWKKYCHEQACSPNTEHAAAVNEDSLNVDANSTKEMQNSMGCVSTVQAVDHEKNVKGGKKPVALSLGEHKVNYHRSPSSLQARHFQKTCLGSALKFSMQRKLNVINDEKNIQDTVNFVNLDGKVKNSSVYPSVPTIQRIIKPMNLPDLEYVEQFEDSEDIMLYPKINKNLGFTLPYTLQEQRHLARRAYLTSLSKQQVLRKKKVIPANKATGASKNIARGITATKYVNPKSQNLSSCQAKDLKTAKKINPTPEKENSKKEKKSISLKEKKLSELQNEVSTKVVEVVLNETLDDIILQVEHEEAEKRISMHYQLNNILQKLNHMESEEYAIYDRWKNLTSEKHDKTGSATKSPSVGANLVAQPLNPVQEKSSQSIMEEIFSKAVENSEVSTQDLFSAGATSKRKEPPESYGANDYHSAEDKHNISSTPLQFDKQPLLLDKTNVLENLNLEKEVFVSPRSVKQIYRYRKNFHQHLKQSSQFSKQHLNFWNMSTEIADKILEECLQEIAEELSEIPSSVIVDLYNQEFEHSMAQS